MAKNNFKLVYSKCQYTSDEMLALYKVLIDRDIDPERVDRMSILLTLAETIKANS